jgi:formylglycine-generating enzyme required for sulfatase activity
MHCKGFISLIFFLCLCVHDPERNPMEFSLHISKIGNGRLNFPFSDTSVNAGSTVVLQAFPDSAAIFLGWFGTLKSTQDTITVTVNSNMAIEARFQDVPRGPQMVEVPSKNASFTMGSDKGNALTVEKPAHRVMFTYTYFIDKYETTQGQYRQLMGINPPQSATGNCCIGDSFPVYYVSWYEAALFCNARSKIAGLDTVYDFTAICGTNLECPYVLENLSIHYDRFGFRLPTEAEWEFACKAGASTDFSWGANYPDTSDVDRFAWYVKTSDNVVNKIGLKKPNAFGLFDMEGNIGEWVNDWLGQYPDTLAVNPIGPADHSYKTFEDSLKLRPVRGGSYDLGPEFLKSFSRKGPYDTWARDAGKNIGFRCAIGVFFPSSSATSRDKPDTSGIVSCNPSDLISFMQTYFVKCVFIKNASTTRKLCYIDFSENGRPLHELPDSLLPHCPTISPNGLYVAYSSKGDLGEEGTATATIRRLSETGIATRSFPQTSVFVPRWWIDQNSLDTFLVFPNTSIADDQAKWRQQGKTLRQKIVNGNFSDVPQIICDTNAYCGGLSYGGSFLATGYPNAFVLNLQANDQYLYFDSGKNGTSHKIQVCNVSINPGFEHQDQIMFLDYGSGGSVSSIVGKNYGFHSIIFTSTSVDSIGWYEIPSGYDKWEDVEWSNNSRYAVVVAQSNSDAEKGSIYCVDLQGKSNYLKIAEGIDIREPYLWIDPVQLPPLMDPYYNFGKYNIPGKVSNGQIPLYMKLKIFWTRFPELQCIAVGSSPTYYGIDPTYITSLITFNLATISSDPFTSYSLASNYVIPHVSNLKCLIMGLDAYSLPFNNYCNGLPRTLGYQFDEQNDFWKNGLPKEIKAKIATYDSTQWPDFYNNGFLKAKRSDGWGFSAIDYDTKKDKIKFEDDTIQNCLMVFKDLAKKLSLQKTHFLVINYPENPLYKNTPYIGRLGPSREFYAKFSSWLRTLEQQNPYFHFYDANMNGDHDYADSEALDCNHLNYRGAKKISTRIDSLFRTYFNE